MAYAAARQDHGDYQNGRETDTAVITVVAKADPKNGQKTGSCKDGTTQGWFRTYPEKLAKLERGKSYAITYHESNGLRFIDSFEEIGGESSEDRAAAKVADAVKQVTPAPQIRANYNNNPGAAVMGMVNQYIGRGDVPLHSDDIARAINECLAGYLKSKLGE